VKFGVLALDYDGTIARDGVLDPEVRSAIADVRARGIAVVTLASCGVCTISYNPYRI
jgi:hydroxymethylpyrimidine pyrophosphatase-like HAD family hydrolase